MGGLKDHVRAIPPGAAEPDQVDALVKADDQIIQDATKLLAEIIGAYADSILRSQLDALRLQLVAAQNLSAARTSRNVCAPVSGIRSRRLTGELSERVDQLDRGIAVLLNDLPEMAIDAPPDPETMQLIVEIDALWVAQKPTVRWLLDGVAPDAAARAELFAAMDEVDRLMRRPATLYVAPSKRAT